MLKLAVVLGIVGLAPIMIPWSQPEITAAQWRQIVNGATDTAIISTDPDGLITSWNEGANRLFGWSEAEMFGQRLDALFRFARAGEPRQRQD